jgi:hypothetical protein
MKTSRVLCALLIATLLSALASCVPHRGSSKEVATDLHNYTVELQKWEEKEKAIFQSIDDVEESQYVDDDFVTRTLKGTLPMLDQHIREVSAYRPATPELGDLHSHYRKGWEDLRAAIDTMVGAVSKKDYVALAKGKSQLKAARGLLLKAFASMDALMEENDETLKNTQKS